MINKIKNSIDKFNLDLSNKTILTEAASGNYVITPIVAALAGAKVIALTRNSKYATVEEVKLEVFELAKKLNVHNSIEIVTKNDDIPFGELDVVTNTGFVRPIDKTLLNLLTKNCVIPLMWEPWEFRSEDLDLEYCYKKGIKVYGTNESDSRLQTMKYIGFTVLNFLLNNKMTPFSTKILILGNKEFTNPVIKILSTLNYKYTCYNDYEHISDINSYQAIILLENENNIKLVGENGFISKNDLKNEQYIIHICGNVDFNGLSCQVNTSTPANFGYMSFTTDYIDSQAVIDLHTAGLKVSEGMLKANKLGLKNIDYKVFMESNYPALAFKNKKFW